MDNNDKFTLTAAEKELIIKRREQADSDAASDARAGSLMKAKSQAWNSEDQSFMLKQIGKALHPGNS